MNRLGFYSALVIFVGGVAYAVAVSAGLGSAGLARPIVDPLLAIMELLTIIVAPAFVVLTAALYGGAPSEHKTHGLVALAFAVILTGVTVPVHFVELTALRRLASAGLVWPSPLFAVELLAWDFFLGLCLLFAATVVRGHRRDGAIRTGMGAVGILCLIGLLGPAWNMRFQLIATFGYAFVFPFVALSLAVRFRRTSRMRTLHLELPRRQSTNQETAT